jgi:hypothetical protein
MTGIQIDADGYVTVNGLQIAFVDSTEYVWLHPRNWLQATRDMTLTQQGALFELIRTHMADGAGAPS